MSTVESYTIVSPEPGPLDDVELTLELLASGEAILTYQQGEDDQIRIYPNLEDLARIGRVAQAIIDGRAPAPRNWDLHSTTEDQRSDG